MNLTKSLQALACAAAMAMGAGAASAATIDFTGSNTGASDGVSTSCQALGIFNANCSVTFNNAGLGVDGNPDLQPGQIDGSPVFSSERLTLSFAHEVVWNSITFGRWDNNDDARLTFDGGTFQYSGNNPTVNLGGAVSSFLTITAYGNPFDGDCAGFLCSRGNDSFTVESIDVAPVPLPAAGGMLLAGLGAFAFMRRRKKA